MQITFRKLQRMKVNDLQEFARLDDVVITVDGQLRFVLTNYLRFITFETTEWCKHAQRCKEGIRCDLTNALVAGQVDSQAGMPVSPLPNSPDEPYHPTTPATKDDEILVKLDELKQMLTPEDTLEEKVRVVAEGVRQVAAERKAVAEKAQLITRHEILKKFEEDHRAPDTSEHSLDTLLSAAKKWLDFVETEGKPQPNQWESRALVNRYLQYLHNKGYKPNYILNLYGIAQMVFKTVDRTWPMLKKSRPRVERRDVSKPTLEPEQVGAMIKAAKDGRLTNEESAFLALSTVYAMRAIELQRVADENIDYKKGVIYVKTAKGGERRDQLLAPEIVSYLKRHKFGKSYVEIYGERLSKAKMQRIYRSIEKKVDLPRGKGFGWHSIRRAIENVLVPWNITVARIFTRWSSGQDIALEYVTGRFEFDQKVFDGPHPFLQMWR